MSERDESPTPPVIDLREPVRTTDHLEYSSGRRRLNQYVRGQKIGKGKHGDVYICRDDEAGGCELAVKAIRRSNPRDKMKLLRKTYQQNEGRDGAPPLSSTMNSIRKEIAIMKKCRHVNLVRLVEIIDDPREEKIYMIMEYLPGGPVEWADQHHRPILMIKQTRRIIRDTILGLEYLHQEGIIHRDIKPANILYTNDRRSVKLIDFGVAHYIPPPSAKGKQAATSSAANEAFIDPALFPKSDLAKRVGTPSFLAPEVLWFPETEYSVTPSPSYESISPASGSNEVHGANTVSLPRRRPPITKAIDIWSLGVTFYCFLFGHTPFTVPASANENVHHNEYVLYNQICTQDWQPGGYIGADGIPVDGKNADDPESEASIIIRLLGQMLQKDPRQRISLSDIKCDLWMLEDIDNPKEWLMLTSPIDKSGSLGTWVRSAGAKFMKLLPGKR